MNMKYFPDVISTQKSYFPLLLHSKNVIQNRLEKLLATDHTAEERLYVFLQLQSSGFQISDESRGAIFGPLRFSWENSFMRKYNGFVPPSDNLYICPLIE